MTTEETSKNNKRPQLVKLNKAFKLAQQWVTDMGMPPEDDEPNGPILEARPPRLGIGAVVPRETKHVRSNDSIERKLRATLNAKERKAERKADEHAISANERVDEDSDDEESESKTKAFAKKRPAILPPSLHPKKKHK